MDDVARGSIRNNFENKLLMQSLGKRIAFVLKRVSDLFIAVGFLVLLFPLMALIALAIKLDDGGQVFFVQNRVGRGRRIFRCYKFRTMISGAEKKGAGLTVVEDDPRITRLGWILRKWGLDELPQLLNVLKGDMSIVGPRPWVPSHAAYCLPQESRRFDFRPGMAGWAWIHGRNSLPWEERIRLDLWYVDHWSLWLDYCIFALAFVSLLSRRGGHMGQAEELRIRNVLTRLRVQRAGFGNRRLGAEFENVYGGKFRFLRHSRPFDGAQGGEPVEPRKPEGVFP